MDVSTSALRSLAAGSMVIAIILSACADLWFNPMSRTRSYQFTRLGNWLAAGGTYMLFYQARYAVVVVNEQATRDALMVSPAGYGAILTAGFWSYAFFTALNGHLIETLGGQVGMLIGCAGCACCCIAMGFVIEADKPSILALSVANVLNMGFNSLAALSVININAKWYSKAERGLFSGIFGVMVAAGYFVALTEGNWIYSQLRTSYVFFAPALFLLFIGVPLCYFVVRNAPVGPALLDANGMSSSQSVDGLAKAPRLGYCEAAGKVLATPRVQATMLGLLGVGWAREGFLSWFASYLAATADIQVGSATLTITTTAMSLCSVVGSLSGGYISDRFWNSQRGPVAFAFCAMQLVCFALLWLVQGSPQLSALMCALLSIFLFGVLSLLMAAASADFVDASLAGMASGLLNAGQYVGSGLASVVAGAAIHAFGWHVFAPVIALGPLLSCFAMAWLMRLSEDSL